MSMLIVAWIQAFSAALIPSLFALALVWLRQHQTNIRVIEAVGRAAGEAYKQMVQSGERRLHPISLAAAVADGRDYLLARIPDLLKAAGVTPEAAAQLVSAELGKLLAIDPTIGVGGVSVENSGGFAAAAGSPSAEANGARGLPVAPAGPISA